MAQAKAGRRHGPGEASPTRLVAAGLVGLAGCLAALAADVVAWILHPHFSPMGETISDLAAGRYAIVADLGLYAFAVGLGALAYGLMTTTDPSRNRGMFWIGGCVALALAAVDVAIIAAYEEYGDGDDGGFVIHGELVTLLGALTLAATVLLARGLATFGERWRILALAFAGLWVMVAPPFFFVPTSLDGGYERVVAVLLVGFVAALSWMLVRAGRADLAR